MICKNRQRSDGRVSRRSLLSFQSHYHGFLPVVWHADWRTPTSSGKWQRLGLGFRAHMEQNGVGRMRFTQNLLSHQQCKDC